MNKQDGFLQSLLLKGDTATIQEKPARQSSQGGKIFFCRFENLISPQGRKIKSLETNKTDRTWLQQ